VQISFDRLFAKNLQIFLKTCAIPFLVSKAFQKAKFYQNLTSGSGSKQRFSLLQEKAVIQAVCRSCQYEKRTKSPDFKEKYSVKNEIAQLRYI